MEAGQLVSDDIMIAIIREAITTCPGGFILDGFPRTNAQALALDSMLLEEDKQLDMVIELQVDDMALDVQVTIQR